jgi:hypothetical protein
VHEGSIDLDQFHGHSYGIREWRWCSSLLSWSFRFSNYSNVIGEDLMFSHIHEDQALFALMVSLSFIIDGLSIMRIYARVFLGPHVKSQYDMAYRSSEEIGLPEEIWKWEIGIRAIWHSSVDRLLRQQLCGIII